MIHRFGQVEIDTVSRTVKSQAGQVALQPRPFALLQLLLTHRGHTVTKEHLIEEVWQGRVVSDAALSTALRDLRRALGEVRQDFLIRTHYGRGISLDVTDLPEAPDATPATDRPHTRWTAPSLAVMPFENLTSDSDIGYLADGLAEDIITKLSRFPHVAVLARNASFALRGQVLSTPEIGAKLGTRYLFEGSIRKIGTKLRLTVQLVEAESAFHLWAEQFDADADEIADVVDTLTPGVATTVPRIISTHEVRSAANLPMDALTSWQAYLLGATHAISRKVNRQADAIALLERAVELDPLAANPHAALSYAINMQHQIPAPEDRAAAVGRRTPARLRALDLARRAIELDSMAAFGRIALARCFFALGDIEDAIDTADKALALNPDHAWGHYIRGMSLWQAGRGAEAIKAFDTGLTTSPNSEILVGILAGRSCAMVLEGDYEGAIDWARKAQLEPNAGRLTYLGEILGLGFLQRHEEAQEAVSRARRADNQFSFESVFHDLPLTDPVARQKVLDGLRAAGMP
ncbi:MAG: winged helix-turn-helix domain-containing protein [Tateyamaria sp.]